LKIDPSQIRAMSREFCFPCVDCADALRSLVALVTWDIKMCETVVNAGAIECPGADETNVVAAFWSGVSSGTPPFDEIGSTSMKARCGT
jgi:hypothetical protein